MLPRYAKQGCMDIWDSVNDCGLGCFGVNDFCLPPETDAELFPGELERCLSQDDWGGVFG